MSCITFYFIEPSTAPFMLQMFNEYLNWGGKNGPIQDLMKTYSKPQTSEMLEKFSLKSGVRQEDLLPLLVFSIDHWGGDSGWHNETEKREGTTKKERRKEGREEGKKRKEKRKEKKESMKIR